MMASGVYMDIEGLSVSARRLSESRIEKVSREVRSILGEPTVRESALIEIARLRLDANPIARRLGDDAYNTLAYRDRSLVDEFSFLERYYPGVL